MHDCFTATRSVTGNYEKTEVRESLPTFGAEIFIFQFATQTYKHSDIYNYYFAYVLYGCETWSLTLTEACRLEDVRE
jgi:hypothetical protein